MIDTDLDRDYAEEDAVRAAVETERAEELAHEEVRDRLVEALRDLSDRQQSEARRLLTGTTVTIDARGTLGPAHLVYLGRAAEVSHLAARTALTVERFGGYALGAQVEALLLAHLESTARRTSHGDGAHEVAVFAAREVRKVAGRALAGTREATGLPGAPVAR